MIKTILLRSFSILILVGICYFVYAEYALPLQQSYATTYLPWMKTDIMLNGSPKVGETGELVMTTVYDPDWISKDLMAIMRIDYDDKYHRITDIVSNVHTGDSNVFAPYDYKTQSQLVIHDYPYVVRGTVEILQEGFHIFSGHGLDYEPGIQTIVAIGDDEHMSYSTYRNEGHTFLEPAILARCESTDPYNFESEFGLEREEIYYAEGLLEKCFLKASTHANFTILHMREFLSNTWHYSEDELNDFVDMLPDGYVGAVEPVGGLTGAPMPDADKSTEKTVVSAPPSATAPPPPPDKTTPLNIFQDVVEKILAAFGLVS